MPDKFIVGEVQDLGGKFSVRLTVKAPEAELTRTEIVVADRHDDAVQIAKVSFSRWLEKATKFSVTPTPRH